MRESFVIHSEYIEDLPADYKTKFLIYIYNFGIHGIVPKCEGLELALWRKIKRRIEGDAAQYRMSSLQNCIKGIQYRMKNDKASETDKENLLKYEEELKNLKLFKTVSNGSESSNNSKTVLPYTPGVYESDSDNESVYVSDNDNDIDNVSVSDNESESEYVSDAKNSLSKPTYEDVDNYIVQKELNVNTDDFIQYYEASNWEGVKNWKQKLLNWDKLEKKPHARKQKSNDKWWEQK